LKHGWRHAEHDRCSGVAAERGLQDFGEWRVAVRNVQVILLLGFQVYDLGKEEQAFIDVLAFTDPV
jgi:hypothetical protein